MTSEMAASSLGPRTSNRPLAEPIADDEDARAGVGRLKLGTQLLLGLAAVSVVVALFAGFVVREVEGKYLRNLLAEESEKKFDLLLMSSLDDIISEDLPRLGTTVEQMIARDRQLQSVEITNEHAVVLHSWRRNNLHRSGLQILSFSKDAVLMGENFGHLTVEWDVSTAYDEVTRHTYLLAGAAGGACVVLSLLVYFIMNVLAIQPINQISRRLLEFRQGLFDQIRPVPPILSMEVHRLDQSANALGEFLTKKEIDSTELARAKEAAEAASLAKTEFLANVSHELRTPLNAVNGFSEVMSLELYGALGHEKYREYAKLIHQSGLHLLGLINDIIDVAKFESGKFDVHYERVDLAQLVSTAVAMVKEGANRGGLHLRCSIAPELPPLIADGRRLQQVLLNLLSNAIKFTPARGMVTISVTWHAAFGAIVEIADTGIGIPADKISVILEPFGQVENAMSRRYQGSGLGLPIAKKFIEVHGGKMHIETRVGEGTKISFDLPASLFVSDAQEMPNAASNKESLLPFPSSHSGDAARSGGNRHAASQS